MAKFIPIGLSIALFLIFLLTLFQNALNAPSFDDYDTTINFIRRFFFENHSIEIRQDILLSRHNEHRILFSKIVAASYYYLFHQISFRNLVLLQNLMLLGFYVLTLNLLKRNNLLSPETILWVTLFTFSLAFWQVTFYYWGGIQHYTVIFFSILSLISLDRARDVRSAAFIIALFSVVFGVLSFGNGFIALVLGGFILIVQKKWRMLIAWTLVACLLLFYTFFSDPAAVTRNVVAINPEWVVRLLFTFLGSCLYMNPAQGQYFNIIVCMFAGFLVLLGWIWLFFNGYAFKNPLFYCLLSLPVLTGIIVAIARFETKAAGGVAPRYMFFTSLIPIFVVMVLLDMKLLKTKHLRVLCGAGLALWSVVFYNNHRAVVDSNAEIVATINKWEKDPHTPLIYYQQTEEYSEIMTWAVKHNVVSIPKGKNNQ
ncbi:hypothetical protein [Dyadobacter sp. CY323]|uniref:hypothetical protein n=1 Tax=Dyadobacter sp. CY323 TaxID=2907302 RepID=UPI001F3B6D16|nr:hypothetical protein [Dyadobacter sp. CY323]MCE6989180.1 hypothetical protein [Dyadobacter sp. CY323]